MNSRLPILAGLATLALLGTALPASAELVFLTSGRTLSVKSHQVDGETMILTLRSGGRVICDASLISKIEADEVAYPEPEPVAPLRGEPAADDQDSRAILDGTPYAEIISSMSEAHGVNPMLVSALIQVESGYRPSAKSPKGAMGLMQLMPSTAREYNVRNPFDPKTNIEAGIKHLKSLIDRFGVRVALAAYNAGEGAVKKFNNAVPPYRETQNYVKRILALAGIN
jgi:soluble lytic murein transglycosylase-like protein